MEKVTNVAVLIDAENVASHSAKQIFDEASNYGNIMVKRIFADWSKTSVRGWKEEVNRYSMTAVQQFEVQARKNTTDIALIIQALLILFEKDVDVFCIAAGDSDYTRLVRELRERDKIVIGLGGRNVNQSYVNAFNEFIYLDAGEEKPAAPKSHAVQTPFPLFFTPYIIYTITGKTRQINNVMETVITVAAGTIRRPPLLLKCFLSLNHLINFLNVERHVLHIADALNPALRQHKLWSASRAAGYDGLLFFHN